MNFYAEIVTDADAAGHQEHSPPASSRSGLSDLEVGGAAFRLEATKEAEGIAQSA